MSTNDYDNIPVEKFQFVQENEKLHDTKFETEPVGYFKDAFRRFLKNKSSVTGGIIIIILIIFAIVVPFVSGYKVSDRDLYYAYVLPKCEPLSFLGMDGCKTSTVNQQTYDKYEATNAIVETIEVMGSKSKRSTNNTYKIEYDTYEAVGYVSVTLTNAQYEDIKAFEEENDVQILYPLIDSSKINCNAYKNDANVWYLTDAKGVADRDSKGNLQDIYLRDENGNEVYTTSLSGGKVSARVLYKEYYNYKNGHYASFIFGADSSGYDILTRLANGARLSLILSVVVSAINLCIGVVIGALEGYYGGNFDLIVERIKDILWEVPTIVIFSLFQLHLATKLGALPSLFFAFVFYGWIGTSSTVRAQMYRFKGQEYVLAARTLGAKDRRLIFRHILPNGIGYIVTASVLSIPSVILSEAQLSYLGIVNLQSDTITSIGTMLNNGQATLSQYPHCVLFPALFIALLLISFNLFGNGLRDALNPALRGTE